MNRLPLQTRAQILHLLVEGSSIRAITRLTGASKNTVIKLLEDAGRACAAYHDRVVRNLQSKRVQVDEIWSFVYAKNANVRTAKSAPAEAGDAWTWTAIDADSKLLISWLVSGRDATSAEFFLTDVRSRLTNRVQLTSDGHRPYLQAVDAAFGDDVDFAMLVKHYGTAPEGERRYSPAICLGATKRRVTGNPDPRYVSTSYAERQNLTMRMHMRRFTRLTNGFSKKLKNHTAAVALHTMFYNFIRIHQTLKMTPAMAAGVTDRLWEMSDLVQMLEAWEALHARIEPKFEIDHHQVDGKPFVRVTFPNGETEAVYGFEIAADAAKWIRNKSQGWLYDRRAPRAKSIA